MEVLDHRTLMALGLTDWRFARDALYARFDTGSFERGLALVNAVGDAVVDASHQPDIDLRAESVTLVLATHEHLGVTMRDVEVAKTISAVADELEMPAGHRWIADVQIAIDTMHPEVIRPFWKAVLDYVDNPRDETELVDPARRLPCVWFQVMDEPRPGRGRVHVDIDVAADDALRRVEAAVAAGGLVVTNRFSPSWWVLSDREGNEVCVCTCDSAPG